ncbi:GlxA family transcriptional regulator [Micromonospora echinofusca]|uniref:Helix-turn-helix domain-containing protein n=1 Tax=Micromonospora echinofusca TaxID=47858 RepID=A0ABS3VVE0_MICEH|nr:GlxA family transcriptional regulator [Micromonospora echinofusca]MBO4208421.1 helix-turn-helix domain-containing protein [Micromonospora echinofusca]
MALTPGDGAARRVVVVGYDDAELLDIACVTSTLDLAGRIAERTLYRTELVSPNGRTIRCDSGVQVHSNGSLQRTTGPIDTLVVSGGQGHEAAAAEPTIVAHVRRLATLSRRVASVCTGATVLAAAGLLDGRRATTHWHYADVLARRYPSVHVDPRPIFIRDGRVATSAGVTSALDLTLALVTEDHGPDLARIVAQVLVTYLQRPGNQAQMSVFTAPDPDHVLVRQAVAHVTTHLATTLDTATLAAHCGVSPRQLHRLFVEHLGMPPGRFVRRTRLDTAARLLSTSAHPVGMIARWCGFTSLETLRQAFVAQYGVSPSQYRAVSTALPAGTES